MPTSKLDLSLTRAGTLAALVLGIVTLTSCGGGGSNPGTGSLSVNLTDAPVDGAANVVVVFTGLELHRSDGTLVTLDFGTTNGQANTKSIDLIKLQNGVTGTLMTQGAAVPAGDYQWMRLKVLADDYRAALVRRLGSRCSGPRRRGTF